MTNSNQTFCAALFLAVSLTAPVAEAATYHFSQDGYPGGGVISGSFTAVDFDNNGILDFNQDTFSAFNLSFSGNGSVAAFSLGLADLVGLVYEIGGNFIGDDGAANTGEGIWAYDTDYEYITGIGPTGAFEPSSATTGGSIADLNTNQLIGSSSLVSVSMVPEPETWALLLAGLGLVGLAGQRRF